MTIDWFSGFNSSALRKDGGYSIVSMQFDDYGADVNRLQLSNEKIDCPACYDDDPRD